MINTRAKSDQILTSVTAIARLKKAEWLYLWFSSHQPLRFCYPANRRNLGRQDCLFTFKWKRHSALYLTGFSWVRVADKAGVSILLCFVWNMLSENRISCLHRLNFLFHMWTTPTFTVENKVKPVDATVRVCVRAVCSSPSCVLTDLCQIVDWLLEGEHDDLLQDGHCFLTGCPSGRHVRVRQSCSDKHIQSNYNKSCGDERWSVCPGVLTHLRPPGPASRAAAEGRPAGWSAAARWSWPSTASVAADPGSALPCWAAAAAPAARRQTSWFRVRQQRWYDLKDPH